MKKGFLLTSITMLSVFLGSCASYRATTLSLLPIETTLKAQELEGGLSVVAKAFNKQDCKRYLDRDVVAEGYQPVQLYVQNNSKKQYLFALNRVSLPLASVEEVAEKVHTSTVGRVVGYGACSLLLWPLVIPAVVDGIKSYEANKALDSDFTLKAARNTTIRAHSQMNSLFFIPLHSYENSFSITLIDSETKEPLVLTVNVS